MRRLLAPTLAVLGLVTTAAATGASETPASATPTMAGAPNAVSAAAAGSLLELGGDDVRLSTMGTGGNGWADHPDAAADPGTGDVLVVWSGDDPGGAPGLADEEDEIWAQRVSGTSGAPLGERLRVSAMGPDGDPAYDAGRPVVAWNPRTGTWLVVWQGDTDAGALVDGELEVWARAVTADGVLVGPDATRVSTMGTDGDPAARAATPDVAAGPAGGWLVAWSGDGEAPTVTGELEVWGRVVADDLTLAGAQQRVSTMGPDGTPAFAAYEPAVAPNPASGGWSVLWWGDDDRAGAGDDAFDVFGHVLDGAGAPAPGDDVALVANGTRDSARQSPDLALDPTTGDYLVGWRASNDVLAVIEVARYDATLSRSPDTFWWLSSPDPGRDAADPVVAPPGPSGEWLVTWWGDDASPPLVDGEYEIWAHRLSNGTTPIGDPVRLSDMGAPGTLVGAARWPAVATTGANRLVVWAGDDSLVAADADTEVRGQLVGQAVPATTRFVPLTPARVLDTRVGLGASGGRLPAEGTIALQVAGRGGVPATGAVAVALNVTLADATAPGFVTAWPTGRLRPLASNLNASVPGQDRANLVIVPLGDAGQVSLSTQSGGHLVADVTGWFAPESFGRDGRLEPLTPARIFDTRDGNGVAPGVLGPNAEVEVQVTGRGGVPASGVTAVVANVTLAEAAGPGFVTAWPTGAVRPLASSLNASATADVVPNLVVLPVGRDGRVSLYTSAGGHLVVDVAGWFTDASAPESDRGLFVPVSPTRVLDTRSALGVTTGRMPPGGSLALRFAGAAGIPLRGAAAVVANLTVAEATAPGFLTAWPPPALRPNVSNVNATAPGQDVANLAVVGLSSDGVVSFFSQSGGHLVADVAGWFTASGPVVANASPPGPMG